MQVLTQEVGAGAGESEVLHPNKLPREAEAAGLLKLGVVRPLVV